MSAMDFAIKNAGKRVVISSIYAYVPRVRIKHKVLYARIIGFSPDDDNTITLEFEEDLERGYCWSYLYANMKNGPKGKRIAQTRLVVPLEKGNDILCWNTTLDDIELCENPKPIVPYPNICKLCKSPARKCHNLVLCSNTKCKSTGKIPYFIKNKGTYTKAIRCPTCKEKVCRNSVKINSQEVRELICINGHIWNYTPQNNDVLYLKSKNGINRRIWLESNLRWEGL